AATERLEQTDQLSALGVIKTRRMPDVLEGLAPIHAEQQGAYPFPVIAPAKAADDAIGGALFFHLDHGALAGMVNTVHALGDDAVEAGSPIFLEPVKRHLPVMRDRTEIDRLGPATEERLQAWGALPERHVEAGLIAVRQQVHSGHGRGLPYGQHV